MLCTVHGSIGGDTSLCSLKEDDDGEELVAVRYTWNFFALESQSYVAIIIGVEAVGIRECTKQRSPSFEGGCLGSSV